MGRKNRIDHDKHAYWTQMLQRWRASGQTIREFCRIQRLHESQFGFWKRQLIAQIDAAQTQTQAKPAFLPVILTPSTRTPDGPIEIRLNSGHRLRVRADCDRQLLAELVSLLEEKPC
jgi:hypothetical protein